MAEVLLPVGHLLGPFFATADADLPESVDIRLGRDVAPLPPDVYVVWAAAHGEPERVAKAPMTRSGLVSAVKDAVTEPTRYIDELLGRGLLVRLPQTFNDRRAFARSHRVLPLALGLGNSAEQPEAFTVGMVSSPALLLSASVFMPWMFGYQYPTLWQVCENVALTSNQTLGNKVRPDELLADMVKLLPLLVSTGCAYTDRRSDG